MEWLGHALLCAQPINQAGPKNDESIKQNINTKNINNEKITMSPVIFPCFCLVLFCFLPGRSWYTCPYRRMTEWVSAYNQDTVRREWRESVGTHRLGCPVGCNSTTTSTVRCWLLRSLRLGKTTLCVIFVVCVCLCFLFVPPPSFQDLMAAKVWQPVRNIGEPDPACFQFLSITSTTSNHHYSCATSPRPASKPLLKAHISLLLKINKKQVDTRLYFWPIIAIMNNVEKVQGLTTYHGIAIIWSEPATRNKLCHSQWGRSSTPSCF